MGPGGPDRVALLGGLAAHQVGVDGGVDIEFREFFRFGVFGAWRAGQDRLGLFLGQDILGVHLEKNWKTEFRLVSKVREALNGVSF